jgi:hypothetical protein
MPLFGSADIGWAGQFVPNIVSEKCLDELRNLAGPKQYPKQKDVVIDLNNGMLEWKTTYRRGRR